MEHREYVKEVWRSGGRDSEEESGCCLCSGDPMERRQCEVVGQWIVQGLFFRNFEKLNAGIA